MHIANLVVASLRDSKLMANYALTPPVFSGFRFPRSFSICFVHWHPQFLVGFVFLNLFLFVLYVDTPGFQWVSFSSIFFYLFCTLTPPVFSGFRFPRSFSICFVDRLSFCPFTFFDCVVCPCSITPLVSSNFLCYFFLFYKSK